MTGPNSTFNRSIATDDSRDSSYITKAGKGWVRASITGFVVSYRLTVGFASPIGWSTHGSPNLETVCVQVRDGAGVHALTLYHADHRTEEGYKVVACNLEQELQSGTTHPHPSMAPRLLLLSPLSLTCPVGWYALQAGTDAPWCAACTASSPPTKPPWSVNLHC
jgi:hypothetical protein